MSGSTGDAPVLEGEHRLGEGMRRGVFCLGLVPVATGLTLREAMWMQCCLTAGVEPGPMPAHAFRRADRHAVEDAMGVAPGLMRAMAADAKRRRRMVDADEEGHLPLGSPSPVDMMTRDFRVRPVTAWHQTSTGRAGVLSTLVAGSGAPRIDGPVIGVDVLSRELWRFDSWATYDAPGVHGPHMTTSPDVFICGLRGNGKSFAAKVMALREIEAGRHVIVQSDREGEWGRVANHVGGQVVSPGGGHYLNPFALPDRPSAGEDDLWRQEVLSGRKAAFMSLAEALREDGGPFPLDRDMQVVVDRVAVSFGTGPMTLEAAVDRLADRSWVDGESPSMTGFEHEPALARAAAAAAARVYAPMVRGGPVGHVRQGVHDPVGPVEPDDRVRHVESGVEQRAAQARVHGGGELVDRPSAAGAWREAADRGRRGGVGPAVERAPGGLVADQAAVRRPLGVRDLADRAWRERHDACVRRGQRAAWPCRGDPQPDADEDHLPSGRVEHRHAQPAGPGSERGRAAGDSHAAAGAGGVEGRRGASAHGARPGRSDPVGPVRHERPEVRGLNRIVFVVSVFRIRW